MSDRSSKDTAQPATADYREAEGLHNNHHARPTSPQFPAFRGESDPAWPVIRILAALRLTAVLSKVDERRGNHCRRIPRTVVSPGRTSKGETRTTERKDAAACMSVLTLAEAGIRHTGDESGYNRSSEERLKRRRR